MHIGIIIKKIIEKKEWTFEHVAEAIGIKECELHQICDTFIKPSDYLLEKFSDLFECPLDLLKGLATDVNDVPEENRELFLFLQPSFIEFVVETFEINLEI
jgi:transcriptional regulator with XRE-family HTH domain